MQPKNLLRPTSSAALALAAAALAGSARAQVVTFSIHHDSATIGALDPTGAVITGASLLSPNTAGAVPTFGVTNPPLVRTQPGAGPTGLGVPAGLPDSELDAVSYGNDARLGPNPRAGSILFSVDIRAIGYPFANPGVPSVTSEASCGDEGASVFCDVGVSPGVFNNIAQRNVELIDGNAAASCTGALRRGLGLIEPTLPPGQPGDDLDALDVGAPAPFVYFSLDWAVNDPCGGVQPGSAPANGFSPGSIMVSAQNGNPPALWCPAVFLGLEIGGPGTDDLDALALWNNANPGYDPAFAPFDWMNGASDMVLFSVRRGSWVIGQPDSLNNRPIEEGDVLMPPIPGGFSPFPAILVQAGHLGLATVRANNGAICNGVMHGDDLDALDIVPQPLFDCDGNGEEDVLDIALGGKADGNLNGFPDACECGTVVSYCTAGTSANGCTATLDALGTPSASAPNGFTVRASGVEGQKSALFFYGTSGDLHFPWGLASSSFLCVKAPTQRMGLQTTSGTAGACNGVATIDFNDYITTNPTALGVPMSAGQEVWMQLWYRDPPAPKTTSLSDAIQFMLCP